MNMFRAAQALFGLVICFRVALAQSPDFERTFYKSNELFESRDYAGARAGYESLIRSGQISAEVLHNHGLACLHQGDTGNAVFSFRRALVLLPRDEDSATNLALARSRAVDRIPRPETVPFVEKLLWLHTHTTPREATILFFSLWGLVLVVLLLWVFRRRRWMFHCGLVAGVAALLVTASLTARSLGLGHMEEGVILPEEVDVFTGPSETYNVYFKLHSGTEVEILEDRGEWIKIGVDADRRGFVLADKIGRIDHFETGRNH